ncbi:Dolichyl-phosphate-mannose-protein mannosyltransferase [Desulfatibacillum alkenivorans DSM 16219]|uniref:Dolichyl-phosphate-mannose-protein mannosyltransferase n=1 Tax=Desulfatibacillum alkenivorans DSM 16219 TaxID=1121393 RepID=A0A1M6MSX7_9BACT|nr:glycosyltransferase family 39 protein [Desulfatibacillum alkenivorans]SHJ86383.1 Dolichyl-phosphate-mannose-protein mannosyltransferase [Desulfatibacillum alkenivorans DSM 16219]
MEDNSKYTRLALAWILGWTIFRLVYSAAFLLSPDETNYWQWGRHLAWGYHDQAPLLGWAIRLSTEIFGVNEFAVRLPSVLSMGVASAYLVLLAGRYFSGRVAVAAALLTQGVLEFNVGGLLATCDGLQAMAWAGATWHGARACEDHEWKQWLSTGFWFGFGLLSKFTMVIFGPGLLIYMIFSKEHRGRLASIKPYAGVVFGLLMFAPVLYWNAAHGWNSARHVAYIGGAGESFTLHFKYFGDLMGSQAALLSPLVFILALWAWIRVIKRNYNRRKWIIPLLFWTSFPMFAGFTLLSFHTRIYGNWPGAAYLGACLLAAAFFSNAKPRLWKWTLGISYAFTILVLVQVVFPILPLSPDLDRPATELGGWDEIGEKAAAMQAEMPDPDNTFLFGFRYQEASELAFYVPGRPETVSINKWKRPNVYDYWWKDEDLMGMDAVGVSRHDNEVKKLRKVFESVSAPVPLELYRKRPFKAEPELVRTVYLYKAYGFKGGLRWEPPKGSKDIRTSS